MEINWRLGLGYSLITVLMWGLLPIALKGVLQDMDPVTITWYRFAVSTLLTFIWYGHRSATALKTLLERPYRLLTITAIIGLLGNYLLYMFGLSIITPEATQVVIQLAPLLLLIGSVVIFKEPFSSVQWLGVIGFSLGLLLFFHHRFSTFSSMDGSYFLGLLLVVFASIAWALYGLTQKQLLKTVSTNDLLFLIYIVGTLFFLPFSEPQQIMQLDTTKLALLVFACLNTLIAYGSFGLAMTHWQAARVSATITMVPLLTAVLMLALDRIYPDFIEAEPIDWLSWLGAFMVVAGSIVAALANPKSRP